MADVLRIRVEYLIAVHGSVRAASKALDIEASYLHRLSTGEKTSPSDRVLIKLGLRRVVTYEPIRQRKATPLQRGRKST